MAEQHRHRACRAPRSQGTVLQLFRRQEPPDQHEGREPLQGKRDRRGLVSATTRKTPQRRNKNRKNLSAKHRNYSFVNTTSSRRASAAKSTWKANSGARRGTWCRSSVSWACRKLLPARSRTTAFIATKKRWRSAASRRPATPCIRRWSLFDKP